MTIDGFNQPTAIDGPKTLVDLVIRPLRDTDSAGCPQTAHVNVGEHKAHEYKP